MQLLSESSGLRTTAWRLPTLFVGERDEDAIALENELGCLGTKSSRLLARSHTESVPWGFYLASPIWAVCPQSSIAADLQRQEYAYPPLLSPLRGSKRASTPWIHPEGGGYSGACRSLFLIRPANHQHCFHRTIGSPLSQCQNHSLASYRKKLTRAHSPSTGSSNDHQLRNEWAQNNNARPRASGIHTSASLWAACSTPPRCDTPTS